jgi:hypothetical protein
VSYAGLSIGAFFFAALVLRMSGFRLLFVGPTTIFFWLFVVYIGIAQIILGFALDGLLPGSIVFLLGGSLWLAGDIITYCAAFLTAWSVGIATGQFWLGGEIIGSAKAKDAGGDPVARGRFAHVMPVLVLASVLSGIFAAVFFLTFGVPIFSDNPEAARYSALESGAYGLLLPAFLFINPLVGGILAGKSISASDSRSARRWSRFVLLFSIAIQLTSVLAGFRSFVFLYALVMLAVVSLHRQIPAFFIAASAAIGVAVLYFLTWWKLNLDADAAMLALWQFARRAFLDSYFSLRVIFALFQGGDHLYGLTYFWDLAAKLPGQQLTFQGYLANNWQNTEFAIALAPTLPGELFANFGWFGIGVGFIWGSLLSFGEGWARQRMRPGMTGSIGTIGLYISLFIFSTRSLTVGFGGAIFHLAVMISGICVIVLASELVRLLVTRPHQ